jgi:hypothetical protein
MLKVAFALRLTPGRAFNRVSGLVGTRIDLLRDDRLGHLARGYEAC